jgi:hypothetical protein
MEPNTTCWISIASNTTGLFEFKVAGTVQLASSNWALTITSPQNLTLDVKYCLEVIGF